MERKKERKKERKNERKKERHVHHQFLSRAIECRKILSRVSTLILVEYKLDF